MREILQALTSRLETSQVTVISEISGPSFEPQHARSVPSTWPSSGLPFDFVPRVEGVLEIGQSIQ